ncbi:hypothetical protein VTN02DRAFT_4743 [Thermoascus thermophilus]
MTRYLTPSKIALLCLVSIYAEGVIPTSSIVPILSFLVSHLFPLESGDPSHLPTTRHGSDAVAIDELNKILSAHASSVPGRSVWELFLRKIWSLDCCDALEVYFANISSVLVKTREEQVCDKENGVAPETRQMLLSRYSPLGSFVRRAQLEFTRLQFHDAVKLWESFIKYRLPTYLAWARTNTSDEITAIDANLIELGLHSRSHLAQVVYGNIEHCAEDNKGFSTKDVERLLEFQIGELQRVGGRVPDDMKAQLEHVISSGVTVPSLLHYLRFLDSWRSGDYLSSFDNLHRYFDYTMHSRDRSFYQYALLNLAILHADFGCYEEAVSAMQEAISVARESNDMNCLNFCMSWLYHFCKALPVETNDVQTAGMLGNEKEGLTLLRAKAKESELWGLLSTTFLSEAKLELQNGESLASVFENIVKASHVNVTKNLVNSMGPLLLLQSSLFARIGIPHLSWLNCEIFRECYGDKAPLEDLLKCTFRSCQLLSQSGFYDEATSCINEISPRIRRSLKANQHWLYFSNLLKLRRGLHRNDKTAAEDILSQLQAAQLPDIDLSLDLCFLKADFMSRKGDYTNALQIVDETARSFQQENLDISVQIRLLCLKARIFAETGQPLRGFSLALRAATISYRSRVLTGLWEAISVLAGVLIALQEFEAAVEVVERVMPQILECGDCELAAHSFSLLGDANMGMAGEYWKRRGEDLLMKEYITRTLEYIDCAFEYYDEIEDLKGQCEMMAKKATVMRLFGDLALANDYAAKHLDLKRMHGWKELDCDNDFLDMIL